MHEFEGKQPVLTSHELTRVGPQRGKQRFDVAPRRVEAAGHNGGGHGGGKPNRPHFNKPSKPAREKKPQGFCHDQLLAAYKGCDLTLNLSDDITIEGKLVDHDRYTLLVLVDGQSEIVFKSALVSIALPKAKVN